MSGILLFCRVFSCDFILIYVAFCTQDFLIFGFLCGFCKNVYLLELLLYTQSSYFAFLERCSRDEWGQVEENNLV